MMENSYFSMDDFGGKPTIFGRVNPWSFTGLTCKAGLLVMQLRVQCEPTESPLLKADEFLDPSEGMLRTLRCWKFVGGFWYGESFLHGFGFLKSYSRHVQDMTFLPPVSYGTCFCRLQRFVDGLSGPRPEYLFQIHLFPLCTGKIFDFPFQPKISMTS